MCLKKKIVFFGQKHLDSAFDPTGHINTSIRLGLFLCFIEKHNRYIGKCHELRFTNSLNRILETNRYSSYSREYSSYMPPINSAIVEIVPTLT